MSNFRPIDRETLFLLPPSVDEWLPRRHLARFVVEVVDGLDLRVMEGSYCGSGSAYWRWTARRSPPTPAATARSPMGMRRKPRLAPLQLVGDRQPVGKIGCIRIGQG